MNTVQDRIAAGRRLKSLFASGGSVAPKKVMFLELGGFLSVYKPFYSEDIESVHPRLDERLANALRTYKQGRP
jgi:hypothetical protein